MHWTGLQRAVIICWFLSTAFFYYCVSDARKKHQRRIPNAQLSFVEMDGADYESKTQGDFNLVACIGASWIFGGHRETLIALSEMAAPSDWVIVGEPYWQRG